MNILGILFAAIIFSGSGNVDSETFMANDITSAVEFSVDGHMDTQRLTDNNYSSYSVTDSVAAVTITSGESNIGSVYVLFDNEPRSFVVTASENRQNVTCENVYLHHYVDVYNSFGSVNNVTLTFEEGTAVAEIYVFSTGLVPDYVQRWDKPCDEADMLLVSTHADDEHLFFAGTLPYHTALGYSVQVAYVTDHYDSHVRQHERLDGLWVAGVRHYPVFGRFPDAYSESLSGAVRNLEYAGFTQDKVTEFLKDTILEFKPLVIMGQDFDGEYSHGQHMLATDSLVKAVELAANDENSPYDTPKTYIHLYEQNPIRLDYDKPMWALSGKTPFQVSQEAFKCHKSQLFTWFTEWLCGTNANPKTKATQIRSYSPLDFGLYRTTVGTDSGKGDLFENVVPYRKVLN